MRRCGAAFLVFTLGVGALQASPGHPNGPLEKHRISHLLGLTVESSDGQKLGRVRNFVADVPAGEITYVILSSGGFLGMGSRLKLAPAEALSQATTKKGILALNTTTFHWPEAPEFRKSELASLNNQRRAEPIYKFYGLPRRHEVRIAQGAAGADSAAKFTLTGQEAGNAPPARPAVGSSATGDATQLASDIIGKGVVNRQQQSVGEVSDLLVDLSGQKPTLAIISGGRLLKKEGGFAVPLRTLKFASHGQIVMDASQQTLEQAPIFTEQAWQTALKSSSTGMIYRFER